MATGRSLHIGLNEVWTVPYGGWAGRVNSCENDALSMQQIAVAQGFAASDTKLLLTVDATVTNVRAEIERAVQLSQAGDLFFLTFSGHGFERPKRKDETWALFDREMIDDEISGLLKSFRVGVRILVVSESCRSGTIVEPPALLLKAMNFVKEKFGFRLGGESVTKRVPGEVVFGLLESHTAYYAEVEERYRDKNANPLEASVILLAACQQSQDAGIEGSHGLFTGRLLSVWGNGSFVGSHEDFHKSIRGQMPNLSLQDPNIRAIGKDVARFLAQRPFTI